MTKITQEFLESLMIDGLVGKIDKRREEVKAKTGMLRAGNTGVLVNTPTGDKVFGGCHRKALLRKLDIDLPAEPMVHKIFESGLAHEDTVVERLKNSTCLSELGIEVKCEDEIPILWHLSDGTPVSGRPDAVLVKDEPLAVFEIKQKQTANGFQNIVDSNKPDSAHLCQAAHYSWQLGKQTKEGKPIPAVLMYSWPILYDNFMRKDFYKSKEAFDYIELPKWKSKEPGMSKMKINPGDKYFHLDWTDEGHLCYYSKGMEDIVVTNITVEAIVEFYEATNMMEKEEYLGPRPTSSHVGNKVSASYPPCNYCQLKEVCDKYDTNYQAWIDGVNQLVEDEDWTRDYKSGSINKKGKSK